jgi:hypothetical protein
MSSILLPNDVNTMNMSHTYNNRSLRDKYQETKVSSTMEMI